VGLAILAMTLIATTQPQHESSLLTRHEAGSKGDSVGRGRIFNCTDQVSGSDNKYREHMKGLTAIPGIDARCNRSQRPNIQAKDSPVSYLSIRSSVTATSTHISLRLASLLHADLLPGVAVEADSYISPVVYLYVDGHTRSEYH
jgi:hypothetical protein